MAEEESSIKGKRVKGSIRFIFMHADRVDIWLMALGFIGIFDAFLDWISLLFTTKLMNTIGNSSKLDPHVFEHNLNKKDIVGQEQVRQAARMRARYLKAILRQNLSYFDLNTTSTYEVITSISNDSLIIQEAISEKVPDFVNKVSAFTGAYMVAFILVWQLAIVIFPLAILLVLIPNWLCGRSLMGLSGKIRREHSKAGTLAEQAISSIRTVYAFVGEKKTLEEFSAALNVSTKLGLRQGLVKGLAIGTGAAILAMWGFILYYGSRLVMYHGAQGGNVYVAGICIIYGAQLLGDGLSNIKDITNACCASKRIMEVIKRIPRIDSEDKEGIILDHVSGKVEFNQVNFSYPSRPESVVLNNFSLTIPTGKTVALVGPSGSGKSTTLSLLQRFYDPLEGEILLDGIPINKLQRKWLRSQMALVNQEPSLFSATIMENILFGKEDATMEDVLEASQACDAHNFISQLPQAYDTEVGEKGVQLSGGQKQRISIARAIIRKPQVLLLDEATSALDSESERIVQEAIEKVVVGRTTIIIAHRLSTIRNADLIVVVENGQVKEIGSHDELMQEENGLYNSLIRVQRMENENSIEEYNSSSQDLNNNVRNIDCLLEASKSNPLRNSATTSIDSLVGVDYHGSFDEDLPKSNPTPSFWRLLHLNKPEWKQASLGCLSAILFGGVQPLYAVTMGTTISVYFSTDHDEIKERIRNSALLFIGLSVFSLLTTMSRHYSFAYMGEYLTKRIRERMLSKILTFEVGWFDKDENSSSVICSKLAKDANVVRTLVDDRMSLLLQAISAVTIAWTMGLVIAWRLALVSIALQPLMIACFYTKRVLLKNMSKKAIKEQNERTKLASEAVCNLKTVTAFSSQDRILKMLKNAQKAPRKESIRQSWFAGIALGCSVTIKNINWCLNYWYGGKLVSKGLITPKAVFQTVTILVTTGRVIAMAGTTTTILAKGWDAIQLVFAILDKDTEIQPENPNGYKPEKLTGYVQLCDVHFAYPSRPNVVIFKGFSLDVEPGNSTALVGKSGSGKSTIIGLIERFYDPLQGLVKIDGRDIKSYHLRSLRKYIALVNQEPTLFGGTIRDNIIYGSSDNVSEAEIIEAARAANVHDFISRQKDGYETLCGDRGLQLSGGQKQRIAIARAILRKPTILLLDEATSALDSQSEKVVQTALEHVMDKGEVIEKGTHLSLMAKGPTGAYHSLVSLQTIEEEISNPH